MMIRALRDTGIADHQQEPIPEPPLDVTPELDSQLGQASQTDMPQEHENSDDNSLAAALKELKGLKQNIALLTTEVKCLKQPEQTPQSKSSPSSCPLSVAAEVRTARCVSELLKVPIIQQNFSLHEMKFKCLLCHVHNLSSDGGVSVPSSDEACLEAKGNRTVQTKLFLNTKQNVITHLKSKTHLNSLKTLSENEIIDTRLQSKNSIAGISIATLIYSMVQRKDSYASFEHRVLACSLIPGTYMGDLNHSRKFVPDYIKTMAEVLRESFLGYMQGWDKLLDFPLPISITADKDTNRHRSRQVFTHL